MDKNAVFKNLLFDLDGTLIDSNGIWKDVDTRFLEKRGLPYTQEYYEGVAHTIFPLAAKFTKEFCHLPESEAAIMAEWMEMAGDAYATRVQVKPCPPALSTPIWFPLRSLRSTTPIWSR